MLYEVITVAATESNDLVCIVDCQRLCHLQLWYTVPAACLYHRPVEFIQMTVPEKIVVRQAPLPPGIAVTPAVSLPREVYPLRMAELITHEVEVT